MGCRASDALAELVRSRTQIYTSGNIENFNVFDAIRSSGASIIFSVYSGKKETHDRITQIEGSYDRTMAAIDRAKKVGLIAEFHFVPLQVNCDDLGDVVKLAKAKGVSQVSVLRFVPQGRGKLIAGMALSKEQNLRLKKSIQRNTIGVRVRTGSPYNFLRVNRKPKCNAGIDRLTIAADLRIYPCDAFKRIEARTIVGTDRYSRLDKWSLNDCWRLSPYLNSVRRCREASFERPCKDCSSLMSCLGGCLAQKYIASGELKKGADPMCLKTK